MQTNLYTITIPIFIKGLKNLSGFIDKSLIHAEGKKYDAHVLLNQRLAPDQFPLMRQIGITINYTESFIERLKGVDHPLRIELPEDFAGIKTRIDEAVKKLEAVTPEEVIGKEEVMVPMPYFTGKFMTGFNFATEFILPNFYFHLTTAYAILRHNGVELGKADFIGGMTLTDAA